MTAIIQVGPLRHAGAVTDLDVALITGGFTIGAVGVTFGGNALLELARARRAARQSRDAAIAEVLAASIDLYPRRHPRRHRPCLALIASPGFIHVQVVTKGFAVLVRPRNMRLISLLRRGWYTGGPGPGHGARAAMAACAGDAVRRRGDPYESSAGGFGER